MFERFRRTHEDPRDTSPADDSGSVALAEREREADDSALRERDRDAALPARRRRHRWSARRPSAWTRRPGRPAMGSEELRDLRARQRARFGGFSWGSDFFGWLSAVGLASILTSFLVAAGTKIGLAEISDAASRGEVAPVSLTGGILLLVVLAVAWFCGGYVAGRMARFDGPRQGLGVWIWTLAAAAAVALLAAIGGRKYDLFEQLNLPRIPVNGQSLTTGGAIALGAALVTTLVFAMIGGAAGERFHRRVDREALTELNFTVMHVAVAHDVVAAFEAQRAALARAARSRRRPRARPSRSPRRGRSRAGCRCGSRPPRATRSARGAGATTAPACPRRR